MAKTEDPGQFELAYEGVYPQTLSEEQDGRWSIVQTSGSNLGVLWTNDDNGLGFVPTDADIAPVALQAIGHFQSLFRASSASGLSAAQAFDALKTVSSYNVGEPAAGKLQGVLDQMSDLNSVGAVTAAAGETPPADLPNGKTSVVDGDALVVTADEDGKVLALIFSDETNVYIRENNGWTPIAEDGDPRVDDQEWLDIDASFIPVYDDQVSTGIEMRTSELGGYVTS